MATTNLQTRTGNRIVVLFDGKKVGLLQSVEMSDDYAPEPASGIGDIHVLEHVPTIARHSLNVSAMILNKGSLRKAGISAENGDAMLLGRVFDFVQYDKDDSTELRRYVGCSYASGSVSVQKHAIVMNSAMFNAIDVTGLEI